MKHQIYSFDKNSFRWYPATTNSLTHTLSFYGSVNGKVLEELLLKLEIEHVTWSGDKKGYYHTIIFPLDGGDPCETTLHCLTKLGIGVKPGSSVRYVQIDTHRDSSIHGTRPDGFKFTLTSTIPTSVFFPFSVIPCSVSYNAIKENTADEEIR